MTTKSTAERPRPETGPQHEATPAHHDGTRQRHRRRPVHRLRRRHPGGRPGRADLLPRRRNPDHPGDVGARRDGRRQPGQRRLLRLHRKGHGPDGRCHGGLALVAAARGGHRRRGPRCGRPAGHHLAGAAGVAAGPGVHGGAHRHEPRRREELRRVRVLVRHAQGGGNRGVPRRRRCPAAGLAAGRAVAGPGQLHRPASPQRFRRHRHRTLRGGLRVRRHRDCHRGRSRDRRARSAACGQAIRTVLWRILVFYIGSVFVIAAVLPVDVRRP